jgi:hypothetical protein
MHPQLLADSVEFFRKATARSATNARAPVGSHAGGDGQRARATAHHPFDRSRRRSTTAGDRPMKRTHFAATALVLAMGTATIAIPAHADAGDMTFEMIFKMADRNNDRMVTKQEFLEAMGKAYDMKMKAAKSDPKMAKDDAMTRDGLKGLIADIYRGA